MVKAPFEQLVAGVYSGFLSRLFVATHPIILVGADATGRLLATELVTAGERVSLINIDSEACSCASKLPGISVLCGDATNLSTLKQAGAEHARLLYAATSKDEVNLRICRIAAESFHIPRLVARTISETDVAIPEESHIEILSTIRAIATIFKDVSPSRNLLPILKMREGVERVAEVAVDSPVCIGQTLGRISLRDGIVVWLRRGGDLIVPELSTELRLGDVLTLIGKEETIVHIRDQLCVDC